MSMLQRESLKPYKHKILEEIKDHYNLSYDTEVIRLALNDAHRIMKEREKILNGKLVE